MGTEKKLSKLSRPSQLSSSRSNDSFYELQEANYEADRQARFLKASQIMIKETYVDFEANKKIHNRAALRGLYGLKNDIFYDPSQYEEAAELDEDREGGQDD